MEVGRVFSLGFGCAVDGVYHKLQFDPGCACEHVKNCILVANLAQDLRVTTNLTCEKGYNLFRRSDSIINTGERAVVITKPKSIIILPAKGPVHGFKSYSINEFVPESGTLFAGKNRSCVGHQPYFTMTDTDSTVAINIIPTGDWRVKLSESDGGGSEAEIDLNDDTFSVTLEPGDEYSFVPEYLISGYETPCKYPATVDIQRYATERMRSSSLNRPLPLVYNSWFDHFHKISVEGMLKQARAAKQVGCEAFVMDAGWFGPGVRNWTYVGDWRENPSVFGEVSLSRFADKIRDIGLDFGIWMEPERTHRDCPARVQHPGWFIQTPGSEYYYPDLLVPEAEDWVYSEICRVIEAYGVKWIKIDCNGSFSDDIYHCGHRKRLEHWYDLMDRLVDKYPDTVFEACASGGLRADLNTLAHYHTHFLSDTVDPIDTINFSLSAFTRLSPRMQSKWAIFYPAEGFTPYDSEPLDTGDRVLSPIGSTSHKLATYDLSFVARAAMPSVPAVGGNIADLKPSLLEKLKSHLEFYKQNRSFIQNSYALPLSGVIAPQNSNIRAMQLQNDDCSRLLVFVYNIGLTYEDASVKLSLPKIDAGYAVTNVDTQQTRDIGGALLTEEGLIINRMSSQSAAIFDIRRI